MFLSGDPDTLFCQVNTMQRRAHDRIPSSLSVRCCCETSEFSGTVTDLSEKGMYICIDDLCFPFDSVFSITFAAHEEVLTLPVSIRRIEKSGDRYDGVGVEIHDAPREYTDFIASLRNSV